MAASESTTKGAAMEDKSGRRLLPDELAAFEAAGEDPSKLSDVEMMRRLRELKPEAYGHIDVDAMMGVQKEVDEAAQEEERGGVRAKTAHSNA
jgi:hypothetical protein